MLKQHQRTSTPKGEKQHFFSSMKLPQHLLTQGISSLTRGIAETVAVKDDDVFFVAEPDGNVPLTAEHGCGLYYHDCRYINAYALRLAGQQLYPLASTVAQGFKAVFELGNHAASDG